MNMKEQDGKVKLGLAFDIPCCPQDCARRTKVAARLGVDRRTMHRHLARESRTFSSVRSVRAELVTRYIENRDRSLASVSELLGFFALV